MELIKNLDIKGMLSNPWIIGLVTNLIVGTFFYFLGKNRGESEIKKVKKAAELIDTYGRFLMEQCGTKPTGKRHFNDGQMTADQKNSVANLQKLGIVRFGSNPIPGGFESSYDWTSFGEKVMKFIGVKQNEI